MLMNPHNRSSLIAGVAKSTPDRCKTGKTLTFCTFGALSRILNCPVTVLVLLFLACVAAVISSISPQWSFRWMFSARKNASNGQLTFAITGAVQAGWKRCALWPGLKAQRCCRFCEDLGSGRYFETAFATALLPKWLEVRGH